MGCATCHDDDQSEINSTIGFDLLGLRPRLRGFATGGTVVLFPNARSHVFKAKEGGQFASERLTHYSRVEKDLTYIGVCTESCWDSTLPPWWLVISPAPMVCSDRICLIPFHPKVERSSLALDELPVQRQRHYLASVGLTIQKLTLVYGTWRNL
jgi:hypothetical protein